MKKKILSTRQSASVIHILRSIELLKELTLTSICFILVLVRFNDSMKTICSRLWYSNSKSSLSVSLISLFVSSMDVSFSRVTSLTPFISHSSSSILLSSSLFAVSHSFVSSLQNSMKTFNWRSSFLTLKKKNGSMSVELKIWQLSMRGVNSKTKSFETIFFLLLFLIEILRPRYQFRIRVNQKNMSNMFYFLDYALSCPLWSS